jgi:hypothetical protein
MHAVAEPYRMYLAFGKSPFRFVVRVTLTHRNPEDSLTFGSVFPVPSAHVEPKAP